MITHEDCVLSSVFKVGFAKVPILVVVVPPVIKVIVVVKNDGV